MAVYYLLGCLISLRSREPLPAGVGAGIAGILLSIPGWFTSVRQFSIFHQMKAADYFFLGNSPMPSILAGILLGVVLYRLVLYTFKNKNY